MQNNINAVVAQRAQTGVPMIPHINHPNFGWAITAEELARVENEQFFEIYNGHPTVHNEGNDTHASTDRVWDIVLTLRHAHGLPPLFGLGTDDSHNYHIETPGKKQSRSGRGWIMLLLGAKGAGILTPGPEDKPPGQIDAEYLKRAPKLQGDPITIAVKWSDAGGNETTARVEDWIFNKATNKPATKGT